MRKGPTGVTLQVTDIRDDYSQDLATTRPQLTQICTSLLTDGLLGYG